MDQTRAPLLEALAEYHEVIDFLLSGLEAGMVLPDPADPKLETIRVTAAGG